MTRKIDFSTDEYRLDIVQEAIDQLRKEEWERPRGAFILAFIEELLNLALERKEGGM